LRRINTKRITKAVKKLFIEANTVLGEMLLELCAHALSREESETGKQVLKKIIENADIARRKKCLFSGYRSGGCFCGNGSGVHIVGGEITRGKLKKA